MVFPRLPAFKDAREKPAIKCPGGGVILLWVRGACQDYVPVISGKSFPSFFGWATASQVSHQEDIDGVFATQPHLIREHAQELAAWGQDRLVLFATALFFMVLVDQVC